ncbi:MAG: substrate-binding domain-containing protein [Rhodospirillaceae bacterium]|nr:substrate-binding domain-containing protein [Rhodospirillaceae bacterium]
MKLKSSLRLVAAVAAVAIFAGSAPVVAQDDGEKLEFNYVMHADPEGVFWNIVLLGMRDACADLDVDCLMIGSGGDNPKQLANFQASVAAGVDGIVTTIIDDNMFDRPVQDALDAGIPVVSANTDDAMGRDGNPRLAYIGSGLWQAAYDIAEGLSKHFPAEGPIHVLVGHSDVTQNFAIQRAAGITAFLDEFIAANPQREITYDVIEVSNDGSVVTSRVGAYLQARPETNAYVDCSIWHPQVGQMLREQGREAGEVVLGGFGAYDLAIEEIKSGWVAVTQDQGAYLQGYLPIVQLYLLTKGLPPFDVDTAGSLKGVVDKEVAETLSGLRVWKLQ